MLQGTASSVGKSLLVAGLCRILRQDGYSVAPFKAQNRSNNSYVTHHGGEMGRAQVVQAQAAGIEPHVDMNPILLKPEADARSQVVVLGRAIGGLSASAYYQRKEWLMPVVLGALGRLSEAYDVVVIEGAGSPAEINLRGADLVNMGLARQVAAPVLLVGDIDRGGVFAHLVGTLELLEPSDRALVQGLIINKFRGDISLLGNALAWLEGRTGLPVLGVVPYLADHGLPEEDAVVLEAPDGASQGMPDNGVSVASAVIDIAVIRLPRVSNFTDLQALAQEPAVHLRYVTTEKELGHPDMVILPGTKSTVADLAFLRRRGLAERICKLAGSGSLIVGICGGFQMLGRTIRDPEQVESQEREVAGLNLLPVETVFDPHKRTAQVEAHIAATTGPLAAASGATITGYEIHNGRTEGELPPAFQIIRRAGRSASDADGAVNHDGSIFGTYIHGLFDAPEFRRAFLEAVARRKGVQSLPTAPQAELEQVYDRWAAHVRGSLDIGRVYQIMGLGR